MGTPTQVCVWSCPNFNAPAGRPFRIGILVAIVTSTEFVQVRVSAIVGVLFVTDWLIRAKVIETRLNIGYEWGKDANISTGGVMCISIMPPRIRTRSAGWPAAESLGGGTSERVGRGGRGRRPREGNDERVDELNGQGNDQGMGANGGVEGVNMNVEGANGGAPDFSTIIAQQLQNLLPTMLAQVSNRGNVGNQNGNVVNENVQENVGNVIVNGNRVGCSYKEFLACNPKEYDGKGGDVVLTHWIEKMENVHDMSGCSNDQKVKYTAGSFVGKSLTWWNSQIRTLSREIVVSMSWNDFKFMMIQEFCPSHEMQKLESGLSNNAMVRVGHAAYTDRFHELARRKREKYEGTSKDKNGIDDNKRTKTGNVFATTVNPVGRENMDFRGVPRNVNPVNAKNPIVRACYECGSTDHGCGKPKEPGRGRQFMWSRGRSPGSNICYRASDLGFRYEIEIVAGSCRDFDKSKVAKSPYHLTPSEMEELSGLLKELQDKEVQFLGHVINGNGIHVDPSKIEAVKNWKALRTLTKEELAFNLGRGTRYWPFQNLERRWIELCSNYDYEIRYHPGKANVVADVLSRKERVKPKRFRAMNMILQSSIKIWNMAAQKEAMDEFGVLQKGLDEMIKQKSNGTLYYLDRIWVPLKGEVRTLIMDEAYKLKYYVHPGADKMYYDLKDRLRLSIKGHLAAQNLSFRMDMGKGLVMDVVIRLKMERLARLYLNEIVARHGVSISIISDCDSHFTSRFWQSMQEALGTRLDMSMAYHPQTDGQSERTIQTLEDILRACILDLREVGMFIFRWLSFRITIVGEVQLIGPKLVQETTEKISQIKDRLKDMRDRQNSYADKRRKPLEFSAGDYVLLKVSPWKGVVRFGKKRKLAPRFVGLFEIIEKVGPVAYRLDLLKELSGVHDTFHVSNLKKRLVDPTLKVNLDEIRVDVKLNFVEMLVEILEREFKKLKRSRIAIVKARWNSKRGLEFT
ncbi:putative reverse transcriptase domain-containing protein [Tanacetum coccineum]